MGLEVLSVPFGGAGFVEHVILPLTSQVDDIDHFAGDSEKIPTLQSPC
jgi:hypothetical protein